MTPETATRLKKLAKQLSTMNGKKVLVVDLLDRFVNKAINRKEQMLLFDRWKKAHFEEIYTKDKGRCYWCNDRLTKDESTIDHMIPTSRGGKMMNFDNVVIACQPCNKDKGNLTPEEYIYKLIVRV